MKERTRITRRKFIEASALAGMTLALPSERGAERPPKSGNQVCILSERIAAPKIAHGIEQLCRALGEVGISYQVKRSESGGEGTRVIRVGTSAVGLPPSARRGEAFSIQSHQNEILINGYDDAGAFYGCAELATHVRESQGLPTSLNVTDSPKMAMRGISLFLMTAGTYMYPINKTQFPWFYDKDLWLQTLDFLAEHRLNFISLWNAHPFPFFVSLEKYPEANMVTSVEVAENEKLLAWLSSEADKRNIWLMFQFYNIYVPEGVAKSYGGGKDVEFSHGYGVLREPTPWAAEYTRYAIKEFVQKYPSLGLYVCLGEALQKRQSFWMDDVIVAGVKDSGKHPPVILRNWALQDDLQVLEAAAASYDHLFTEMKHNDEMYAVTEPDPANLRWIQHSPAHIINVHLTGNLKPFRWAPPSFIQETAKNQQQMGAKGVQVYPLWVWYWPYSGDAQQILQIRRDWLWFAAWGRYSWNWDRPADQEKRHWAERIGEMYGREAASNILDAYEATGRVMPMIPRMFWFDGWNHWFASNGLTLDQVLGGTPLRYTNVERTVSVESLARDLAVGKTPGNDVLTPLMLTNWMVSNGERGVEMIRKARLSVKSQQDEFDRLQADFEATFLIAQVYRDKIESAVNFVAYQLRPSRETRAKVLNALEKSVAHYRELAAKTTGPYRVANDIRNDIPFPFQPASTPAQGSSIPHLPHWRDFLPVFEAELDLYRKLL